MIASQIDVSFAIRDGRNCNKSKKKSSLPVNSKLPQPVVDVDTTSLYEPSAVPSTKLGRKNRPSTAPPKRNNYFSSSTNSSHPKGNTNSQSKVEKKPKSRIEVRQKKNLKNTTASGASIKSCRVRINSSKVVHRNTKSVPINMSYKVNNFTDDHAKFKKATQNSFTIIESDNLAQVMEAQYGREWSPGSGFRKTPAAHKVNSSMSNVTVKCSVSPIKNRHCYSKVGTKSGFLGGLNHRRVQNHFSKCHGT